MSHKDALIDVARVFLRLGTTAFGGPAAHIALMEDEIVRRRGWLTRAEFLDYLGATNLIPGPNSTELAIHIGFKHAGWKGLIVAGACFILPAAVIVAAIAWAYVRYGALPDVIAVLDGVKPVVIAVVAHALWLLGRSALKTLWLAALAAASIAAIVAGAHELAVLAAAGVAAGLTSIRKDTVAAGAVVLGGGAAGGAMAAAAGAAAAPFSLATMFGVFVKTGAVLFGSGYVLLAFLRADFIDRLGWLTERQLLDAIAVGQVTPGPVFTTATFIGYILGGPTGAVLATAGIFLPAFVFVALSGPLVPRLRRSPFAAAALDGVNAASLALMAVVTLQLASTTLTSWLPIAVCAATLIAIARYRINPTWPMLLAAVSGWVMGPQ